MSVPPTEARSIPPHYDELWLCDDSWFNATNSEPWIPSERIRSNAIVDPSFLDWKALDASISGLAHDCFSNWQQACQMPVAPRTTSSSLSLRSWYSSSETDGSRSPAWSEGRGSHVSAARAETTRHAPYDRSEGARTGRWQCLDCTEVFSKAMLLDAHAKKSRHRAYKCPECTKTYVRQSTLARHRAAAHSSSMDHPCVLCREASHPKTFRRKDHLQQHLREVHNRFDYTRQAESRC